MYFWGWSDSIDGFCLHLKVGQPVGFIPAVHSSLLRHWRSTGRYAAAISPPSAFSVVIHSTQAGMILCPKGQLGLTFEEGSSR